MRRVYHRWHSPSLGHDMELLEFGHAGLPLLVFPTSMGRFYEYEDRGMVGALADKIEAGWLRLYCADSIDSQSWYDYGAPPERRLLRHHAYEAYLLHEVLPLAGGGPVAATGCSFGGFHCVNFALKHPDAVSQCISMGGAFDLRRFFGGWYGEALYFNQPLDFLPNLDDGWFWERYQAIRWVLATGEHDVCRNDNLRLSQTMRAKSIPHALDIWGEGAGHDWPWWQRMARAYF